jgi:hypothetical protein
MDLNKDRIKTQEEEGELAPIDQIEARVEAEMKLIEGRAKESVAEALQDEEKAAEARKLKEEAEKQLSNHP